MASQEKLNTMTHKTGLPRQAHLEELYYKAIQDAKLDDLQNEVGPELGPPGYSTEDFRQWARKIDIYRLGEGAADFATEQQEEIVKEFGAYRKNVVKKLSEELTYENLGLNGQLRDIGSCIDGSKVGSASEMDSLYVIQGSNLTVEKSHKQGLYHVYLGKDASRQEIQPRRLREQLADKCSELISRLKLPHCLQHGGYKSPSGQSHQPHCNEQAEDPQLQVSGYSGLRYNGPAVTSQFLTNDNALLTWDITPVVVLHDDAHIQATVRESESMQAIIADNPEKMFPPSDVHLFPDATTNLWRPTTAEMEANLLCRMSKHAPFKEAFSACKVLSTHLKKWANEKARFTPPDVDIVDALIQYIAMKDTSAKTEATETLNRKMRFAHIWIPIDRRDEYHEDKKVSISINNAAVKHILMKAASHRKGAFGPEKNPDLVKELIRTAFHELSQGESHGSEHAFLPEMWISHFSVAPAMAFQKGILARDIKQQCRTLLHEAMTEPLPMATLGQTVNDLNRCAVEQGGLRCAEYSFKLSMNPWQHPELDMNIHHLFTLVTSLCNTCGGVIFLTADDPERNVPMEVTERNVPMEVIERFQSRLIDLIHKNTDIRFWNKINFTQVPFCLGKQTPWTAIHLVTSGEQSLCLNSGNDLKLLDVRTNLSGFIQMEGASDHHQHVEQGPSRHVPAQDSLATGEHVEDATETGALGSAVEGSLSTNSSMVTSNTRAGATNLPVDFSTCSKLDWSKNKKDWESYVHGETPTTETIVDSCSLWKPAKPMTITPDKTELEYWFASVGDMEKTLTEVDTKEAGFAVVCKTWKFHISNSDTESRPPGHICDILTVSMSGKICLWVICSNHDEQNVSYQMEYLLTTGRMIKYRLVQEAGDKDLSHVFIACRLFCPNTSSQICDVSSAVKESLEMENHISAFCKDGVKFESLQRALALVILSKESPLKRPVGNQTTISLSTQQVQVLSSKDRVNYISGPAGSGKSYTASLLCQMYGRTDCVYICTTLEFVEYLKFSGYKGTLIQKDQDLFREIQRGTFKNKTCVIIDDSHNFACKKSSMTKLFRIMKDNKGMSLYVFADNDYQSFDKKRQQAMSNCIRELSLEVLGKEPHYTYLTAIYRNTKKVVSFVQSAIQDSFDGHHKIESQNVETGDEIECIKMTNIWMHLGANDLVDYLHTIWAADRYKMTETAVLLDPSFTSDHIEECRSILRERLPNSRVQSARVFPRKGVVVDSVTSFLGLDAPLCVFVLPHIYSPWEMKSSFPQRLFKRPECDISIGNPRFKVFMASRATHKAVFVVPRMNAKIAKELKFDLFEPAVDYGGLEVTGRRKLQAGCGLKGLCYSDDGWLYVGERWEVEPPRSHRASYSLALYRVQGDRGDATLIDRLELGVTELLLWSVCPRVESQSRQVFVPCRDSGVTVARLDGDRLVREKILRCVRDAVCVDAMSPDTVYVCDGDTGVHVVDVVNDKIASTLEKPRKVMGDSHRLAVLGDNVMVNYSGGFLVVYSHGSPAPVRVIAYPGGLKSGSAVSTDCQRYFLATDWSTDSVFVMDVSGNLCHRVHINPDSETRDCAVVNRQLWVLCGNGDVVIMSSQ